MFGSKPLLPEIRRRLIGLNPMALQELCDRQQTMHCLLITGNVVLPNIRKDQTNQRQQNQKGEG